MCHSLGAAGITGLRKHDYNISSFSVSVFETISQGMDMDLPEGQHTKMASTQKKARNSSRLAPPKHSAEVQAHTAQTCRVPGCLRIHAVLCPAVSVCRAKSPVICVVIKQASICAGKRRYISHIQAHIPQPQSLSLTTDMHDWWHSPATIASFISRMALYILAAAEL